MGSRHTLYLGAYARCKNPRVEKPTKRRSCPKKGCTAHEQYVNSPHCAYCGTAVEEIDVMEKWQSIDSDAVRSAFRERLYAFGDHTDLFPELNLWVPNSNENRDPEELYGEEAVSATTILTEMSTFVEVYAKEIFILRKHYGVENVELLWGVIGAYS